MEERKEKTHMTQADVQHFTPWNYSDERFTHAKSTLLGVIAVRHYS